MRQTSCRGFSRKNKRKLTESFDLTFLCIYDVISLNNFRFSNFVDGIYPIELDIKDTTDTDRSASCIELHLEIDSEGAVKNEAL